ncbi:hypothetical protein T4E_6304, partial [Trichinella pseudospiralis]
LLYQARQPSRWAVSLDRLPAEEMNTNIQQREKIVVSIFLLLHIHRLSLSRPTFLTYYFARLFPSLAPLSSPYKQEKKKHRLPGV